jgi:hypothetical protein
MTEFDPGCVKTLEAVVTAQQTNRTGHRWQIFHSRTASCLYQSFAETTHRMVFRRPRLFSDIERAILL